MTQMMDKVRATATAVNLRGSKLVAVALCFLLLASCAGTKRSPAEIAALEAKADAFIHKVSEANAEALRTKGLVYFYRPNGGPGFVLSFPVWDEADEDNDIVAMHTGGYYLHFCDPGHHTFVTRSEAQSTLSVDCQPGQIQFVKFWITMGFFVGRPVLEHMDSVTGANEASNCGELLPHADKAEKKEHKR